MTDALMYMLQVLLIIAAVLCGVAVVLVCSLKKCIDAQKPKQEVL